MRWNRQSSWLLICTSEHQHGNSYECAVQGPGVCDHNEIERYVNLATSIPYLYLGQKICRSAAHVHLLTHLPRTQAGYVRQKPLKLSLSHHNKADAVNDLAAAPAAVFTQASNGCSCLQAAVAWRCAGIVRPSAARFGVPALLAWAWAPWPSMQPQETGSLWEGALTTA